MPRQATPEVVELSEGSQACPQEVRLGLQLLGHQTPAAEPSWWDQGWLQEGQQKDSFRRLFGLWDEPARVFFPLQRRNCRLCLARSLVPEGGLSQESPEASPPFAHSASSFPTSSLTQAPCFQHHYAARFCLSQEWTGQEALPSGWRTHYLCCLASTKQRWPESCQRPRALGFPCVSRGWKLLAASARVSGVSF